MKIAIGSDHAGFEYKQKIVAFLKEKGHEVIDLGTNSPESTDYPLFIIPTGEAVAEGKAEFGIVLGGSGNGEAMAANKVKGVRCALCWNTETAEFARRHNNANVLSIGQRMTSFEIVLDIITIFMSTPFDGGRHERRIRELSCYETTGMLAAEDAAS